MTTIVDSSLLAEADRRHSVSRDVEDNKADTNDTPASRHRRQYYFTESLRHAFQEKTVAVVENLQNPTEDMDRFRHSMGLYHEYALAESMIGGEKERDKALLESGGKQLNHVKATDGWLRSMITIDARALDVIWQGFSLVMLNATICTILHESVGITYSKRLLGAWNTVFSLVLTTSLAFLLVFRLNRIAMRYWEARSMWGDLTKHSRSLVSMILVHCSHNEKYRDSAISWVGSFAVAVIHFMRNDKEIPPEELSGFLTRVDVHKMQDSNHYALYAASRIRYALVKAMTVTCDTPIQVAHSQSIQLNLMEEKINELINQVSGMEKIRSTPLPIVYVSHLRTFLFLYLMFLPYIWVDEWGWSTIPLMAFTAFALMGIEGAATECEVPFRKDRANHLAMEGYAMVLLNNIQGLVIQAANMDMEERQNEEL